MHSLLMVLAGLTLFNLFLHVPSGSCINADSSGNFTCPRGCEKWKKPLCPVNGGSANKRTIGYWQSWATARPCAAWSVTDIDATKWTHINFAFALINKTTYEMAQMAPTDVQQYMQLTDLKRHNPNLKVFVSIGGWNAGGAVFLDMVSSTSGRSAFINSLKRFLRQYVFDGVDINWEYLVPEDHSGNQADSETYVEFLKELRAELGTKYGVTASLPVSFWHLQHFDAKNLAKHIDWFNMQKATAAESVVQAHSNLTEIDQGLDLLWRNGIDPQRVVLGLGFYGSAFTLESSDCSKPGCRFSGSAEEGRCTEQPGILSNSEIQDIITDNGMTPILVKEDAVKYITWDSNQWVSYDDEETFRMKREYANSLCLGGISVWALDLDKPIEQTSVNNLLGSEMSLNSKWNTLASRRAIIRSNVLTLGLFWTACQPPFGGADGKMCPEGYRPIALAHGKVFDADLNHLTGEGCHGGGVGV
ncbi:hypothetical protein D0864_04757 [Hortaea werneckii]|uniref:chitinase n=1 Tax=Hortaea werneckii TaxID=91943 RepID=A0A3M7GA04_HORWE|nr:hypothetical protein D0864_04757 [Hortaea werneckii]